MHHKHSDKCCPITGFGICCNPAVWRSMFVMALWLLVFEWFWHTRVLKDIYHETAHLWRGKESMEHMLYWLWGGIALTGAMAAYIFTKGCEKRGCKEGLRFGIVMTLLVSGFSMVTYAVQPIPMHLMKMWILGNAIQFIVGGFLLTWVYGCCNSHCATKEAHCSESMTQCHNKSHHHK